MTSGVQVRRGDTSESYVFINIIPKCHMHLKGKYYREYKAQYKRMGTGALDGIRKFTVLTKISINIADEVHKNQYQLAAQHLYLLINCDRFRLPEDGQKLGRNTSRH